MHRVNCEILHPNPQLGIRTDASKKGWGEVLGSQEIGGRWMDSEATNHINILELPAAFFALKAFASTLKILMCNYKLTTQQLLHTSCT